MASLQNRILNTVRAEVTHALAEGTADTAAPSRAELQQQITDLHEHLHHAATTIRRLEARVDALEQAAASGSSEAETLPRRTARKRADS